MSGCSANFLDFIRKSSPVFWVFEVTQVRCKCKLIGMNSSSGSRRAELGRKVTPKREICWDSENVSPLWKNVRVQSEKCENEKSEVLLTRMVTNAFKSSFVFHNAAASRTQARLLCLFQFLKRQQDTVGHVRFIYRVRWKLTVETEHVLRASNKSHSSWMTCLL